ncbi:MAG: metallophosphoesterase [Fimbriimonadales bacterium]
MNLTILHTNDVHNRWSARLVETLQTLKASHHALLLDAGDCIRSGNLGVPLAQEPAWDWMRQAGYDALTMGNREFHITPIGFKAKLKGVPCPVLCANLRAKQSEMPPSVQPVWQTVHLGVRVSVLGLTVPMVTPRMKSALLSAYLFDPPIETAQRWVAELRPQSDLLIALTHLGAKVDRQLAQACPDIDLIIGGHSHTPIQPPERIGTVWLTQSVPFGKGFGVLQLSLGSDGWLCEAHTITDLK